MDEQVERKKLLTIATALVDHLFQAFTAVSGSPSAEESCISSCLPGSYLNPFALEKEDDFLVKFCCRHGDA